MSNYWKRYAVLLAFVSGMLFSTPLAQAESLIIATGIKYPLISSQNHPGFLDLLAKEAFKRAGVDIQVESLPAKRVLVSANQGLVDGCLLRIEGLEKYFPNLVMIPETTINSQFVAYSTTLKEPIKTWKNLEGLLVGYVNGWKIFEKNVTDKGNVNKLRDAVQMFKCFSPSALMSPFMSAGRGSIFPKLLVLRSSRFICRLWRKKRCSCI